MNDNHFPQEGTFFELQFLSGVPTEEARLLQFMETFVGLKEFKLKRVSQGPKLPSGDGEAAVALVDLAK